MIRSFAFILVLAFVSRAQTDSVLLRHLDSLKHVIYVDSLKQECLRYEKIIQAKRSNPYDPKISKIVWFSLSSLAGSFLIGSGVYVQEPQLGILGSLSLGASIPFLVAGIKQTARYYEWERNHP